LTPTAASARDGERIFGASERGRRRRTGIISGRWFRAERMARWVVPSRNRKNCRRRQEERPRTLLGWRGGSRGDRHARAGGPGPGPGARARASTREGTAAGWHLWPAGTTRARDWAREPVVVEEGTAGPMGRSLAASLGVPFGWIARVRDAMRAQAQAHDHCGSDWNYHINSSSMIVPAHLCCRARLLCSGFSQLATPTADTTAHQHELRTTHLRSPPPYTYVPAGPANSRLHRQQQYNPYGRWIDLLKSLAKPGHGTAAAYADVASDVVAAHGVPSQLNQAHLKIQTRSFRSY
jgi:hypothetical protein